MSKKHTWSLDPDEAKVYLQNLLENIPDILYFKDLESRFMLTNESCRERHGFATIEESVGKTDADIFTDVHAKQALQDEQKIIQSGQPIAGLEEMETWPDGRITWASSTKMPFKDREGNIIGTFGISRDITAKKKADMLAAAYAAEIKELKEAMEEEVRMAGELQKAFFPRRYPLFPANTTPENSCLEISHFNQASGIVGGDLCSIKAISDTEVGIFLCDVMGHGVRAALGTAIIRSLIEELTVLEINPGKFLTFMNSRIAPIFRRAQDIMFITAIYLVLDTTTGRLRYASAGHPIPLHHTSNPEGSSMAKESPKDPALALFEVTRFKTIEHTISPGDTLLLYTDGTYEACNPENEQYGVERMTKILAKSSNQPMPHMLEDILQDIRGFSGQESFEDDVCMIGLKWHGPHR